MPEHGDRHFSELVSSGARRRQRWPLENRMDIQSAMVTASAGSPASSCVNSASARWIISQSGSRLPRTRAARFASGNKRSIVSNGSSGFFIRKSEISRFEHDRLGSRLLCDASWGYFAPKRGSFAIGSSGDVRAEVAVARRQSYDGDGYEAPVIYPALLSQLRHAPVKIFFDVDGVLNDGWYAVRLSRSRRTRRLTWIWASS